MTGPRGGINRPFLDRFWSKVDVRTNNECWPWLGALRTNGYGHFVARSYGKNHIHKVGPHVVAWELTTRSEVPHGFEMHHTCEVRHCCNPTHLLALSRSEHGYQSVLERRRRYK